VLGCIVAIGLSYKQPTTIFTCTTYFDFEKQDKWTAFCKAMDTIQTMHTSATLNQIQTWYIVNEYSPSPKQSWAPLIHAKYPFVTFIQKGPSQKGQAASMNLILEAIQPYKYWIHWEETWYCRSPCLDRMLDVIQNTSVTQLQVTQHKDKPNWLDSDNHPKVLYTTRAQTSYYRVYPASGTTHYLHKSPYTYSKAFVKYWPLYSLLPSINRVCHYKFGTFSTDPVLWPYKFEWDFGRRWLLAGNTKAVLPDGPVIRDNKAHKSTYS